MIDRRPPTHLAILVGISAGAYAVSLAGMTGLQSLSDERLSAAHEPFLLVTESAASTHDRLEATLGAATRRYDVLVERYSAAGFRLSDMERSLDTLGARAASLGSAVAAMPDRISLPPVRSAPRSASPPKVQATTGASG